MRYSLLTSAIIGAATVSGLALPDKRDYSDEGVCKVETVTVKLTSLDHFVGHTFDLLTPQKAVEGVLASLNKTKSDGDDSPDGPALVPSVPVETFDPKQTFLTVPLGAEGTFKPTHGSEGGDSPIPTGIIPSGVIPTGIFPTGPKGDGEGHGSGSGKPGNPIPTGKPGSGYDMGDYFESVIPEISSALDQLTKGTTKTAHEDSTKTGEAGSSSTSDSDDASSSGAEATTGTEASSTGSGSGPGASSGSNAPFPIPTGGSNSTIPATESASASITSSAISTSEIVSSSEAASTTEAASSSEASSSSSEASSSSSEASSSSSAASSSASESSSESSSEASSSASSTVSSSSQTSSSTSSSASASATGCANPKVRPEWRDMSDSAKRSYAEAIKCLMDAPSKGQTGATSRWEDLASLHQQQNARIHGVGQFLPFHRYFLHVQETLLSEECSYNGPLPWWDETKDAGRFEQSPVFDSRYLGSARVKTGDGLGACVTDGVFADLELNIGPGNNNQPHCLSRAVDNGLSRELSNNFIAACNSHSNYADMLNCAYPGPHAYGHDAVGAVMADVLSSPGDPVFFLHHGMVDRAWKMWQSQSEDHLNAIGGFTTQGGRTPTTLSYTLSSLGVLPDVEIEKVMDTEGEYLCYEYSY